MVKEKPSVLPGLLFGLGFGGFVDGIVLREILQWHHMICGAQSSETLAGLPLNVAADGFFHVVTGCWSWPVPSSPWCHGAKGALRPHGRFTSGCWWPSGASSTSLKDLIDHQLLGVHHARDDLGTPLSWDIGFLVFGVTLIGAGWVLYRRGSRELAVCAT